MFEHHLSSRRRVLVKSALAAGLLGLTTATRAQAAWPSRPVRLVVPYSAGGGTDAVARLIAERITHDTKWPIVVDNKPGGAGNIGLDIVAKAPADGYILGLGQTANLAINPVAMERIPFNERKDFVAVAAVAEVPTLLVVRHADTTEIDKTAAVAGQLYVQTGLTSSGLTFEYRMATGNDASFTLLKKDGSSASLRKVLVHIYYISACSEPVSGKAPPNSTAPSIKAATIRRWPGARDSSVR